MKRLLPFFSLIFLLWILSGCDSSHVSTDELLLHEGDLLSRELPVKYSYEEATCRVSGADVIYGILNRGDEVLILQEDDSEAVIVYNGVELLIPSGLVRSFDDTFDPFEGFTKSGTSLFNSYKMSSVQKTLGLNTKLTVIDSFNGIYYVMLEDGTFGYVYQSQVSEKEIKISTKKMENKKEDTSVDSGGGFFSDGGYDAPSSGPSGGGGSSAPAAGDGGDMSASGMSNNIGNGKIIFLSSKKDTKGMILADGITATLGKISYGDSIKVISIDENVATVLFNGQKGTVDAEYIRLNSDDEYTAFNVYSFHNTKIYNDITMTETIATLETNTVIVVLDELDGYYVVRYNDQIGYVYKKGVSQTEVQIAVTKSSEKPLEETTTDSGNYYDGGGYYGGGGSIGPSGGDSGGGGSDSGGGEWTAPAL